MKFKVTYIFCKYRSFHNSACIWVILYVIIPVQMSQGFLRNMQRSCIFNTMLECTCSYGLLEILYFPGFLDPLVIPANDVIFLQEKLSIGWIYKGKKILQSKEKIDDLVARGIVTIFPSSIMFTVDSRFNKVFWSTGETAAVTLNGFLVFSSHLGTSLRNERNWN